MKFITEEDLRAEYKSRPFTGYETEPGTRLTPGARQFLSDRGIRPDIQKEKINVPSHGGKTDRDPKRKLLISKIKSAEALFLLVGAELAERDGVLFLEVMKLHRQLGSIRAYVLCHSPIEDLKGLECAGMCKEDCSGEQEDCFDITEFHIQTEEGAQIAALHRLRCALRELDAWLEILYPETEPAKEREMCREITEKISQIINSLSIRICLAFGGKICQKK